MTGQVDWNHFWANRDRLENDAQAYIDSGDLQNIGLPPGFDPKIFARAIVTILDKHPEAVTGDVRPNGKPLTNSQKRAQRRRRANEAPDKLIDVTLTDDQYKIIPAEDYVPPPSAPVYKDGKEMPPDWVPISMNDAS